MKKFNFLFVLFCICFHTLQGQDHQPRISSPWGNYFVHYYDCGGQETHDYIQDFLVYKLENLTNGMHYLFRGQASSVFDYVYHETINTDCFELDPPERIWNCSSPGSDTVVLIIEGQNENLVAGASDWIPFTLDSPYPWDDVYGTVNVSVVAPYYISGPLLACSSPVSFDLNNVPLTRTSVSWQIKQ